MAKELPKISDAEWQVMKVLWQRSPLSSSEIIAALKPGNDWSPKTIHTLINRLVNKKAIGVRKDTSFYLYFPLVTEEDCQKAETRSFLKKVYDGSVLLLITNFLKEEKLSQDEIEELRRILDKGKERGGK